MKIELNLETVLGETLQAALAPEALQAAVGKVIEKAVADVVGDVFGYNSEFRKNLKAQMAQNLPGGFEAINRFGDIVGRLVTDTIESDQNRSAQQVVKFVRDATGALPPSITVKELAAKFFEEWSSKEDLRHESDYPTFIIERVEGICAGQWRFYADKEGGKESYECQYRFHFNTEGECYSIEIQRDGFENDKDKKLFRGAVYGLERYLGNLYSGGTKVILGTTVDHELDMSYPWA